MKLVSSLSAKIIAAVFALVALAFVADTLLTQSITRGVYEQTERLTGEMRMIVEEKDNKIQALLKGLLSSREQSQDLNHTLEARNLRVESEQKAAFLEGTRHGISLSVASLVSAAMMAGDAASALDQIDTLLEEDRIAAINLWRTNGQEAFRDNVTIDAVNQFVDAEVFEPRDPEPANIIPENRQAVMQQALAKNSNYESVDDTLEDDEGNALPVTYSYFLLKNSENCQACHDPAEAVRGIVEVAVPNSELADLRQKSEALVKELDTRLEAERADMVKSSEQQKQDVQDQTERYTTALNQANAELDATREQASMWSVGSKVVFFMLTMGLLGLALRHLLSRPLNRLTDAIQRLARNDLTVEATGLHRKDEIGAMSNAIVVFKDNALERQKLEKESKEHFAAQQARQELIDNLLTDFRSKIQSSLETVAARASSMQEAAISLNGISADTSTRAQSVNEASGHSAGNVQMMAAASSEMSSSISEIGNQVNRTNDLVTAASREAQTTDAKVAGLASAAEQIGEVISLIKAIAEQTNMLALNATIEAARAGEAGRGFAVVASEVKNLAAQTSKATEDIEERVQAIQSSTTDSVEAIRSIAAKMSEISEFTTAISAAVHQQNASTSEISRNIQQAAEGTRDIEVNIAEVASSTELTRSSAGEVEAASKTVATVAADMRSIIDDFLERVAAA